MRKEDHPVFSQLLSSVRLVSPGDAAKDTALAFFGFTPALLLPRLEGALLVTLVLGVLNLLVVAAFRAVELYLKYFRKGNEPGETNSPRQD